jgi:hypothetical protein
MVSALSAILDDQHLYPLAATTLQKGRDGEGAIANTRAVRAPQIAQRI